MDSMTYELLESVPAHADYAVDATDLDPEDIPQSRIEGVMGILRHTHDDMERFLAIRLLTSWGYREGLVALEARMSEPGGLEGFSAHQLHGYDDTYRHVMLAVIRYFSNVADRGEVEEARAQIYAPLSRIISLASSRDFEISAIFDLVSREGFLEFIPQLEQYLLRVIEDPDANRWKIADAAECLLKFDADFVLSAFKARGLPLDDFRP